MGNRSKVAYTLGGLYKFPFRGSGHTPNQIVFYAVGYSLSTIFLTSIYFD